MPKKYGHLDSHHKSDPSIKDGLTSNENPPAQKQSVSNHSNNVERSSNQNINSQSTRSPTSRNGNVLNFGIFTVNEKISNICPQSSSSISPFFNGRAPYSAIVFEEICLLRSSTGLWKIKSFDPITSELSTYKIWKYGIGDHSSSKRLILESFLLQFNQILKVQLEYDISLWMVHLNAFLGRNLTRVCNYLHINDNSLQLPMKINGETDYLSMVDSETHNYILLDSLLIYQ